MTWSERAEFTLGMTEYVVLRLARRFVFPDALLRRAGGLLPYYRTNANEVDARPVVEHYERSIAKAGLALPPDPVILEIGSGATNAIGYALAQHSMSGKSGTIVLFEPYAPLDEEADRLQRGRLPPGVADRVHRASRLDGIEPGSVDLVLSHSVLEHVRDPDSTFAALARVLAPSGFMVHAVDYRDHFFKYPYHFLLFSDGAWSRWLDPGDLPRWRLGDHLRLLARAGFRAEVIETQTLDDEFARISSRIDARFDRSDPTLPAALATIVASHAG